MTYTNELLVDSASQINSLFNNVYLQTTNDDEFESFINKNYFYLFNFIVLNYFENREEHEIIENIFVTVNDSVIPCRFSQQRFLLFYFCLMIYCIDRVNLIDLLRNIRTVGLDYSRFLSRDCQLSERY
jgi:hypothetical protein